MFLRPWKKADGKPNIWLGAISFYRDFALCLGHFLAKDHSYLFVFLSPYCGGTCQILVSFKLSQFSTSRSSNKNIAHSCSQFFFIMISAILNFLRDQEIIVFLKLSHFIDSSEKLAGKNYFTETIMHFYL